MRKGKKEVEGTERTDNGKRRKEVMMIGKDEERKGSEKERVQGKKGREEKVNGKHTQESG